MTITSSFSSLLLTAWIIANTTALLVPSGSASSNFNSISSSSATGRFSNSSFPVTSSTSSYSTSLQSSLSTSSSSSYTISSASTGSSSSSSTSLISVPFSGSTSSASKHTPSSLPPSPASNAFTTQPSPSSVPYTRPSSSGVLGPSSGFRSPSRPDHRISSGVFPPTPKSSLGTNLVAASSGERHGPFPSRQQGASGRFASSSANATTFAPTEWPSGVPKGTSVNTITKVPPPIGYNSNGPIFGVNETLPNSYASGVLSLSYGMGNCSMSPGADGYNAKSCSCVNRIGAWYHDYATATVTTTSCQTAYDPGIATDVQQLGCVPQTVTELAQQYTAPADCCDKCGIVGSAVRLLYWPPQTSGPASASGAPANYANVTAPPFAAASSGFVSDGQTFVSPSVYVIYTDIKATASCVARVNSQIPLGPVHSLVTRAYAPQALSTAICQAENLGAGLEYCVSPVGQAPKEGDCFQGIDLGWAPINYAELAIPPPDSVIYERKRSCFPAQTGSMDVGFLKSIFLNPQLSFPSDVSDIDPIWKTWGHNTCTAVNLGVGDPPSALGQATALVPQGPFPAQQGQGGFISDCLHCLVGPGLHTSANDLLSTPAAAVVPGPTAEPAAAGQSLNSPNAQQTNAPAFVNVPEQGAAKPSPAPDAQPQASQNPSGGDPVIGTPQQVSAVPDSAGSSPNPTPVPAPPPTAITLQPQQPIAQQGVIPQENPTVGQAVNGAINNAPINVPASQPASNSSPQVQNAPPNNIPGNSPAPTDPVPLVAAVSSVNVGGQPVFQPPNSNIIVAGSTIPPGGTAQIAGHSVSNGINNIVVDGSTQSIIPSQAPTAGPAPSPVVGGQQVQKQQNGNLVVAGSITVPPGVQTNIAGQQISNGPSQVEVNGQTFAAAPVQTAAPLLTDGDIVHMTNGGLEIGLQTIIPGSQVTVSGHIVNYANPSQVIVDGATHGLAAITSAQPLVVAGQTLSRASNGGIVIAGSTIAPDGVATVGGHTYSLAGSSSIIEDRQTYSIPPTSNAYLVQANTPAVNVAPLPTSALTLANGLSVTPEAGAAPGANPTYRLPNGADISAGGSAILVSGTTYSALPSGEGFVVNGKSTLALPMVTAGAMANAAVYTVAGQVFTANPTGFDIGSATITPGGSAITIAGTVISLDKSNHLQIGSSTMDLTSEYPIATNDVVSLGGSAVTAAPTGFVVHGTTVSPGGSAVTIDGTVISLDNSSHLKIASSTILLPGIANATATATSTSGLSATPPTPVGSAGAAASPPTTTTGSHSGAATKGAASKVAWLVVGALGIALNM